MYIGIAIILSLFIILIVQHWHYNRGSSPSDHKIIVETPKGLIKIDPYTISNKLQSIKTQLINNKNGVSDSCKKLTDLLDQSITNLHHFIRENPKMNSRALCQFEFKNNIIEQTLSENNPDPIIWENNYKTILEWESDERHRQSNQEKLAYLIKNIDIAIKLLRKNVCHFGHINLIQLYQILAHAIDQVCTTGHHFILDKLTDPLTDLHQIKRPRPHFSSVSFQKNQFHVEPFVTSYETPIRCQYQPSYGSSLLDDSIEGKVEQDILKQKTPGHLISLLDDKSAHYTTNVNACLGKTVSDDQLWSQCTVQDMKLKKALQGEAQYMISDLDQSYHI